MKLANQKLSTLENVDNYVFFIYHCDYTVESFFKSTLDGCTIEDGYLLMYKGKLYTITKLTEVGVQLQRDISMYRLVAI